MTDELKEAQDELARATARAEGVAQRQGSVALERVDGKLDAERTRADMEVTRREMERAQRDVQRAADRIQRELKRRMTEIEVDLRARMDAINEALEPVRKRIALMEEGLETLSLYISAANGVVTIRDGERADALEPIIIRQMVLAMDEETGLFAEEDGMVAENVKSFDKWLLADPEHVQQVIPESKAVVALVARWREREHGNPWSHDPRDKVTHFLVRNGDALFRTTVNEFHAGPVLIPTADEFVGFFFDRRYDYKAHGYKRVPVKPGTRAYADAMEASDARGRHYLRIGLILQGLVDNSEVFEPLHPAGINMLTDPSARSEKVRIVTDAEGGLGSGEATFEEWREQLNAQLRPGMRVIGAFDGGPWYEANEWRGERGHTWGRRGGHSRVYPTGWNHPKPPSGVPLRIEWRRPDGGLVCPFDRGTVYDPRQWIPNPEKPGWGWRGGERPAKQRASVTIYPHDDFVLPFDLIESSEQLARFLRDRRNREKYRAVWPLIRSAMFAKREEEAAEAPFAEMLAGVLARENGVTVEEAQREVPGLIRWFKLKNRWARSLVSGQMIAMGDEREELTQVANERTAKGRLTPRAREARERLGEVSYDPARYEEALARAAAGELREGEHEALAVRLIVAEHARRLADRRRPISETRVAELRREHPEALLIVRPRKGGYLVLLPADPTENVFVHELDYPAAHGGKLKERRDWRLVSTDRASRWTVAYEHPRWEDWVQNASDRDYLSGPEFGRIIDQLRRYVKAPERLMLITYRKPTADNRGRFTSWVMTKEGTVDTGPSYTARDYHWRRSGGTAVLLRPREVDFWHEDEHTWGLSDSVQLPWEGTYSSRHTGDVLWGPDLEVTALWTKLREVYLAHKRAEKALNERASRLSETIADQWRALEEVRLRQEFLAEVPDATWDEWQEHLKEHSFYWHDQPDSDALWRAIRVLVIVGVDPTGMTAQGVLDAARENGMPATWKDRFDHEHKVPERLPDAWASLIVGRTPVETPTDPMSREEEKVEEHDGVMILDPEEDENEPTPDEFDALRAAWKGGVR